MPRITPGPPCQICSKPSLSHGLCSMHLTRWRKYGDAHIITRPADWGQRDKHPQYERWKSIRRAKAGCCAAWMDDFWKFVEDIGEQPGPKHELRRDNAKLPYGPDNCHWRNPILVDRSARDARSAYCREWHKRNPVASKNMYLKKAHGITVQQYDAMLYAQGGACAICGGKDENFRLAVDHCHETKRLRGLLCAMCNRALGGFKDSIDMLQKAASYLERHGGGN